MSTYNDASLIYYPSGYKASKAYSLKPTDGSGDLTFTRASTATRVNEQGLIEGVRTNLILQSNTFSDASWNKVAQGVGSVSVVTPNYTTDPFGGNNAWRFQCNLNGGTTSNDRSWMLQSFTPIANSILSIYIKLNVAGSKTIILSNGGGNVQTITSTDWVRINIATSGSSGQFRIGLIGNATSDTLDCSIAFAQAETGDIATEYIPTTTTAVSVGMLANVPRIDYTGGGCGKLLLEPQRTNLLLYSELFNNAYWTSGGITITPNSTTSPDGTLNAQKLTSTSYNSVRRILSVSSSTIYTQSFYFKKDTSNESWVQLSFTGGTAIQYGYRINWTSFTISKISGAYADPTSVSFTSVGDGWYRFEMAASSTNNTSVTYAILPDSSATSSIFAWGAQFELGSYPTSYIPTTSTAVTRVADSCFKENISSVLPSAYPFTLYAQGFLRENLDILIGINNISDTSTYYNIGATDNGFSARARNGSESSVSTSIGRSIGTHKVAAVFTSSEIRLFANGVLIATGANATTFSESANDVILGQLRISADVGKRSSINEALVFPTALSDADLIALTTL